MPPRARRFPQAALALGAVALAGLAVSACERAPTFGVAIPGTLRLAELSADERARLEATLVIEGVLSETPLALSADLTQASGDLLLPNVTSAVSAPYALDLRLKPRADAPGEPLLLARATGTLDLAPHEENALAVAEDAFDTCGAVIEGGACAFVFDQNRNGTPNLEDLLAGVDPLPPPPFLDAAPDTLQFPSGIRLGSFARQVIVVENTSASPLEVRASLVGAPGVTLSRYETVIDAAQGARRSLDLGVVQPFEEAFLAVSFAPVNPYLTTGAVFLEAYDPRTRVRQATRVKVIANADGELRPPAPGYSVAPLRDGAALGGYLGDVVPFPTAELFSGLAVTGVPGEAGGTNGLPYTGRKIHAVVREGGVPEPLPADAVFLVEVPAQSRLSVALTGLTRDVDLAVLVLDDDDGVQDDPAMNHRPLQSGTSPEAVELRNDDDAPLRALVVLGRVEASPPPAQPGALSASDPTSFDLSTTVSSAPEFTAPIAPLTGPIEGGNRVVLTGRGFHQSATVTFADALALDCGHAVLEDGTTTLTCTTPPGSLLVGKNPATVVVANPSPDEGGDGQAATFPEGYTYLPPAPRLDELSPRVAPTAGSAGTIAVTGAFFSTRHGPPRVRFGQVEAASVTFVDAGRLDVVAPPHAAGVVSVTVQNRLGADDEGAPQLSLPSNARTFTYIEPTGPAPSLTGVSPSSGSVDGGELVTVTGADFTANAVVTFGGLSSSNVTFESVTELRARVPARTAPGVVDVEVVNADGQSARLEGAFTYFIPSPTVSGVFPSEASTAGGTFVVVSGTGFRAGAQVLFSGPGDVVLPAPNVNRVSATTLLVATPAVVEGGDYALRVVNADGQGADYAGAFRFVAPAGPPPRVDALDPPTGPKEEPTLVTVTGVDFRGPPVVLVGSESASVVDFVDNEPPAKDELSFLVPPSDQEGPVVVRVINDDGQSDTGVFTYYTDLGAPPQIFQVTPGQVPLAGGEVVVRGAAFASPGARVLLAGVEVGGASVSPTQVVLSAPERPEGSYTLSVVNPDGQAAHTTLRYQAPPLVLPVTGLVVPERVHALVPGDLVSVTGQHLAGVTSVTLQRAGGGTVIGELPITAKTDVVVTVRNEHALTPSDEPGSGAYELVLSGADFSIASPPFQAVAPRVMFVNAEGGEMLFFGDMLNPAKLLGGALTDPSGINPPAPISFWSKTETFASATTEGVRLLPGVPYALTFTYEGALGPVVPFPPGPVPMFGDEPLGIWFEDVVWLPADVSLAGRTLTARVPGLAEFSDLELGSPSSWVFSLEPDGGGAPVASGVFERDGEVVLLSFDPGAPAAGSYRLVLSTERTPQLARSYDAVDVSPPRIDHLQPDTVTRGGVIAVHGRFSAGDRLLFQPVNPGAAWQELISASYDPGDGAPHERAPYLWATAPLFGGTYQACVLSPSAAVVCVDGVLLTVQPPACGSQATAVGLGGQIEVTLDQVLTEGCFGPATPGHVLTVDPPGFARARVTVLSPDPPPPGLLISLSGSCDGGQGCAPADSGPLWFELHGPGQRLLVGGEGLAETSVVLEVALMDGADSCFREDDDGDGFDVCGGDCAEGDGSVNPNATEVCNGIDDDCDGVVDGVVGCEGPGSETDAGVVGG